MRVLFLLLIATLAWTQTAVIPAEYATKNGNSNLTYAFAGTPTTAQYLYSESLVLGSGIKPGDMLTGIRFRMKSGKTGGPPMEVFYNNWDLTLSKSTRAPGMLTGFTPTNTGADAVKVRSGKLTMPANSMPSDKLLNDFGLYVPFMTPYTYKGGDLLLYIAHDASDWDGFHQLDAVNDPANLQSVAVLRYNVASTDQLDPIGLVMQLSYTRPAATGPAVTAAGVLNAASYDAGGVAPGEIVTIYGDRLGQTAVVQGTVTNAKFNTVAGTTRVLFDGVAAPMIYSSEKQVAAVVPYAVAGKSSTQMTVEVGGVKGAAVAVPVVSSLPGLFTIDSSGKGQAAVLNENGTLNGAANPAAAGSIVVIYLTGEGQTSPVGDDGALAVGATLPKPVLPVSVTIGGNAAEILYAGAAPGAVAGLMQINARINPLTPPLTNSAVIVKIGEKSSPIGVTIAVR